MKVTVIFNKKQVHPSDVIDVFGEEGMHDHRKVNYRKYLMALSKLYGCRAAYNYLQCEEFFENPDNDIHVMNERIAKEREKKKYRLDLAEWLDEMCVLIDENNEIRGIR